MEIFTKIIISVDSFLRLIKILFGTTSTPFVVRPFVHLEPACSAASLGWSNGLDYYQLIPSYIIYIKLPGQPLPFGETLHLQNSEDYETCLSPKFDLRNVIGKI